MCWGVVHACDMVRLWDYVECLSIKQSAARKDEVPVTETSPISPPFSLVHRFKPIEKAQCYMMGTFAGEPKTFVTNVSVQMSHDFSNIMQQLLQEANEGKFDNKGEAVRRRDHLVAENKKAGCNCRFGCTSRLGCNSRPG